MNVSCKPDWRIIIQLLLSPGNIDIDAVCDNAAEFLAATYRQPLLAVSAVAPGLYARVPTLARAHELRMKATRALAAARGAGPASAAKVSLGFGPVNLRSSWTLVESCRHRAQDSSSRALRYGGMLFINTASADCMSAASLSGQHFLSHGERMHVKT